MKHRHDFQDKVGYISVKKIWPVQIPQQSYLKVFQNNMFIVGFTWR